MTRALLGVWGGGRVQEGDKVGSKINIVNEKFLFFALKTFLVTQQSNRKYNI
jgi:hypothetical protein